MINSWIWPFKRSRPNLRSQLPPPGVYPTVEWQVAGHCNYDCVYCIQSPEYRVGSPETSVSQAIVDEIARLPGRWEIKMTGGEPFAYKPFMSDVIPRLMNTTNHYLSVLTNFSAPISTLSQFSTLTGDRLRIVSASFHPDSVALDPFVAKATQFQELLSCNNEHSSFVVNVVLVPRRIEQHFQIKRQLEKHGIRYFPQLMKTKGGVYPYEPKDRQLIENLTDRSVDPHIINRSPSYQNIQCDAGVWYFIIDQFGEAYTCRTGKKFSDADRSNRQRQVALETSKSERNVISPRTLPVLTLHSKEQLENWSEDRAYLGNLVHGTFKRLDRGGPCPYTICPCTAPVNRGIVKLKAPLSSNLLVEEFQ